MSVKLYIGNKRYSSWSMRPWLCLVKAGIEFEEHLIPLDEPGFKEEILSISKAGTVPILVAEGSVITESLAIAEWAAEIEPSLWPKERMQRTEARAAASLMHAGFAALRKHCPMNIDQISTRHQASEALADAERIDMFWCDWLERHGGPFLFGEWSIVDAFYAPVVTRFQTYQLPRSDAANAYINRMLEEPAMVRWIDEAAQEAWRIDAAEAYL